MSKKHIKIACQGAGVMNLDSLHPMQGDLKSLSRENYEKLRKEILVDGFSSPFYVWENPEDAKMYILDGHQRFNTLKQMRDKEDYVLPAFPVVIISADSKAQAAHKLLAFASQFGKIEDQGLFDFMNTYEVSLDDLYFSTSLPQIDMEQFGSEFFDRTIESLNPNVVHTHVDMEIKDQFSDEDEVPEIQKNDKVKLGDVYVLGRHRLMCGDSTSIDSVNKLMEGNKADMVFTDPPYGVSFKSNMNDRFDVIKNDDKFLDISSIIFNFIKDDSAAFIWTSHHVYPQWRSHFEKNYKQTIVWSKGGSGMGDLFGQYALNYELCLFCTKGNPKFRRERGMAVWNIAKDAASSYVHPTQKPVVLAEKGINDFSNTNDIVMDIFGGSGSTLIACEKTIRRCYMMELDPHYCAVIIERWQSFSGKKAVRSDGLLWNDIKSTLVEATNV